MAFYFHLNVFSPFAVSYRSNKIVIPFQKKIFIKKSFLTPRKNLTNNTNSNESFKTTKTDSLEQKPPHKLDLFLFNKINCRNMIYENICDDSSSKTLFRTIPIEIQGIIRSFTMECFKNEKSKNK